MKSYESYRTLISAERQRRDNFRTLLSCVLPRPIAFVSTVSADGIPNLAPFSFFNAVGSNPPAVIFSPCTKADGTSKDTLINLRAVPEFVVNVVPHAIREAMNQASFAYPPEEDEFEAAGFTPLPSKYVRPPRAAESPVHLECRLVQIVPVGDGPLSANICIGEVLCFHLAEDVALPDDTADAGLLDLLGRLGGDDYCTIRDRIAIPKPTANHRSTVAERRFE
ncbi:MAG: flavin reductase family protein [Phycisphaerae bacterium]|nr:flavin reductase family protein [Phycisphaerae bacterium]